MSLLGIDVGTSGCKAAVFSQDGRLLSSAYEEYDYLRPEPGWAELDSLQVWEQIQHTIHTAVTCPGTEPVNALCVSSLGEAVVPVSANRQILGPSILNFDSRGAEYLPALRAALQDVYLYQVNGNTLGNHYSLPKLLWLKHHQPDLYQQTDYFLHWSGFVSYMLGAEPAVDYSLANRTLLFDLVSQDWSDELLEQVKLERTKLPRTFPAGTVIGALNHPMAVKLGLKPGIPIALGGHDQSCNGVGCGVIAPGQAMYGMGTYICAMPVFNQRPNPAAMIAQGLCTEHHVIPGQFVSFIYNQGGALVKWFRDTFAALERQQNPVLYPVLLAEMPAEPSRVLALPHFTVTGPPHFIDNSCGILVGLHLDTSRGEILKGLLESATFYLRECFEAMPEGISISDFQAVGGGSKSDAWLQISADILGKPFIRPQINEAGALGAAIIAGSGSGVFASLDEGVKAMVKLERTFTPDANMQARYDERFEKYKRLRPMIKDYLSA
jgi:xylulokinase